MRRIFRLSGREPSVASDVKAELDTHLALKADALVRAGWSPEAAVEEARRQFGPLPDVERRTRLEAETNRRRRSWSDRGGAWVRDIRLAARALRRAPGYTAMATIILGLGIGASVAVLGIADKLLLTPLPIPAPDRVVVMLELGRGGGSRTPSYPTTQDWQRQATSFEAIAYVPGEQVLWQGPAGAESVVTAFPSPEFFTVVGTPPLLGRTLTAADDAAGDRVAVLSHRFWRRRFGADPRVIGTILSLASGPATIVGVLSIGFQFPSWADLYLPIRTLSADGRQTIALRGNHADALVIGRLARDVSAEQAVAAMGVVAQRLAREYPAEQEDWTTVALVPIRDWFANPNWSGGQGLANPGRTVLIFAGAVGLVLLIACANVAGLTLVRGQSRERELAVRAALGAQRWQLIRQRLFESAIVAGLGGAIGVAVAAGLLAALKESSPDLVPRLAEVGVDGRLVAIAAGLAMLAAMVSGVMPALRATAGPVAGLVKSGSRSSRSRAQTATQRTLVVLQLGLAVTLLIGAGVLVKSFLRVIETPIGFDAKGMIAVTINPSRRRYPTAEATLALYRRLEAAVKQVPGIESVGLTNHLPISGASLPTNLAIEGYTIPDGSPRPAANFRAVSPAYFDTMRIPIRRGRVFTDADLAAPNDGLVVNETLARRYWPDQDPLGRRLTIYKSARWLPDFGQPISGVVIGVVGAVHHFGAEQAAPDEVYVPYSWNPWAWTGMVARTGADPQTLVDPVWRAISGIDPDIPIATGARRNILTFASLVTGDRGPRRLLTSIAVGVGGVALLLSIVGLYGLMAYLVHLRRQEIGIRGALGATQSSILALVMRQGLSLTLIGTAVGVVGGLLAASALENLVFGVSVRDLTAFAAMPILLVTVAVVATFLPARRASRLDPTVVLKGD